MNAPKIKRMRFLFSIHTTIYGSDHDVNDWCRLTTDEAVQSLA